MSTANTYALADRVVIVTGAGSGMGRAIARGFLVNGARVVVAGRRPEPLTQTLADADPARARAIPTDISDHAQVRTLISRTVEAFGRLDVVVNSAAGFVSGQIADLAADQWRSLFATNIDGLFHLAKEALPHLEATRGTIIAISSVSGIGGDWGQAAYNSTKHAVNGLVRSLALDYGERGVRINAVAPSFTLTDLTAGMAQSEEDLAPFTNRIALGRPGRAEDVVGPTLFLASDDAAYITGTVLMVDGGTSASTGQPHIA